MSAMYLKMSKDWNENFMGYCALAIIVSACLGGITVMSIFQNGSGLFQLIQLFFVVVFCNVVLASILTVQKPDRVLKALIACVTVCTIIASFNFIF